MSRQYFTVFFSKYVPTANSLEDKHQANITVFIALLLLFFVTEVQGFIS
jgi:hypothetical protein